MEEECGNLGLGYFVTAPDPMGPDGIPGAQKFILEDVPRQVDQHGKNIAVFSTNCGMQEPLITAALEMAQFSLSSVAQALLTVIQEPLVWMLAA